MKYILSILLVVFCCSTLAKQAKHIQSRVEPSVLVLNLNTNQVAYSSNADQVRAIASITKLMTAMITLDYDKNLDRKLMLDTRVASHLPKQFYSRRELLTAMLVQSDNAAAETIANDYPGGRNEFIWQMNQRAKQWEMFDTAYRDPSGLDNGNISTTHDLASLLEAAMGYWVIEEASKTKHVAFETKYKNRIRTINLAHTSGALLFAFDRVIISKTGLTNAAGWCASMIVEQNHQQYAVIVLGSRNKQDRLNTVKNIMYNRVLDTDLEKRK